MSFDGIWQGSAPTAVSDVAALLDSPEVAALIAELDALRWTGRKGYGVRALVGACLVKSLFALPTWTRVAALIEEHPGLQAAIGGTPSIWACYRFANKLREQQPLLDACLDRVAAALRAEIPRSVGTWRSTRPTCPRSRTASGTSSTMAPSARRTATPTPPGATVPPCPPARAEASTGTSCTWPCAAVPIFRSRGAWRRHGATNPCSSLRSWTPFRARGFKPETCAMDKGYDNNRVLDECRERDASRSSRCARDDPIPLTAIPFGSNEWKALYRRRASVEREFGRLKHDYGLAPLRVRGLARVQLHADLTILARLGQALARTRELRLVA